MKLENNKNIFCSVSAGYSSVLMAIMMPKWFPDYNIINVMANTSKEHPESLRFMNDCDKYYKLNLVWVEAQFNKKGKGVSPIIVKYKDLKRKGEIFKEGIKKLGIPSQINKWCNRDMKLRVMKKYVDTIFGRDNYSIAVGLRIDEIDRIRKDYKTNNIFYPLMDHKIDTRKRNEYWNTQPIKINIPAFKGNCDLCFEKSNRKLLTILNDNTKVGNWWTEMIEQFGSVEIDNKPSYNDLLKENNGMSFYREYNTVKNLIEMAKKPFSKSTDEYVYDSELLDHEGDCGSGCQVF